ncbi:hypothetical protein F0562_008026 [Nyssa sinensis]|uniref:Uncharacterized protein n=1 Tax=Nyssa sinensis TaxID=561372 RepID=A0A5J5A547_9ASTE|nr:hypothetical protein F0562_008026 [Nyssa sinensis]
MMGESCPKFWATTQLIGFYWMPLAVVLGLYLKISLSKPLKILIIYRIVPVCRRVGIMYNSTLTMMSSESFGTFGGRHWKRRHLKVTYQNSSSFKYSLSRKQIL